MPPSKKFKNYARRVNSNGEDVYPTVCATQYKGVQRQIDVGGYYILEYKTKEKHKTSITPLTSEHK